MPLVSNVQMKREDDGIPRVVPPSRNISRRWSTSGPFVQYIGDDDIDAITDTYVQQDKEENKTLTRRIVEGFLQNYSWYFPGKDKPYGPKLAKAYAFYEHFTLARHFTDNSADHRLERAEPGEKLRPTTLYSPLTTPESALGEFGIGVAIYFTTLRVIAVILLIAGLIQIPNMMYFGGSTYSNGQPVGNAPGELSAHTLRGTAICTEGDWVVCTDCDWNQWNNGEEQDRFGNFTDPDTGDIVNVVIRNGCARPGLAVGMTNYAALIFLVISFHFFGLYQRRKETLFDEEKQTATDYTVVVKNPPPEEYDPEKWRDFFSTFAEKQVTAVTVTLNNHLLMRKLLYRRVLRNKLKAMLPKNFDIDDEDLVRERVSMLLKEREGEPRSCTELVLGCTVMPILRLFYDIGLPPDVLTERIFKLTNEIKDLVKQKYDVTQVFVTFETEAGQRTALEALTTSKLNVKLNRTDHVDSSTLFEGRVLNVEEPSEPNTVRWFDLHVGARPKIVQRLITLGITCTLVVLCGWLVYRCRLTLGSEFSGPLITVFNSIIPQILRLLLFIENHADESSRQKSLYIKITLFRWVNTAILTKLITPFTSTISGGNRDVIVTIHSILWSEMWLAPGLRYLDIFTNIQKHFIAPRERNQELMNLWFQGTPYNLGERYTDMTKVIFLCCFYSSLFPSSFFFCAAILIIQYYTDKFCLMRIWAPAPFVGPELAQFSRRFFFSGSLLVFGFVSSYDWAQFPYDQLCDPEPNNVVTGLSKRYANVKLLSGVVRDVTVDADTNSVFCSQSWRNAKGFAFPATATKLQAGDSPNWMTSSQSMLTTIYGWSTIVLLITFFVVFFGQTVQDYFVSFCYKRFKPNGVDAQIDFQSVKEISLYIPQFKVGHFQYPVLACDVDDLNQDWVGWTDADDPSYDKHNLIFDLPWEGMRRQKYEPVGSGELRKKFPIFALVKSWSRRQEAAKNEAGQSEVIESGMTEREALEA